MGANGKAYDDPQNRAPSENLFTSQGLDVHRCPRFEKLVSTGSVVRTSRLHVMICSVEAMGRATAA